MPHTINIFPWRLYQAKRRAKTFLYGLFVSSIVGFIFVSSWLFFSLQTLTKQEARNNYLVTQNTRYVPRISGVQALKKAKNNLLSRIQLTDQLQQESELVLLIWQALSHAMPKDVYLTSVTKRNAQITIEGRSKTSKAIAQLMKKLTNSRYFGKMALSSINTVDTGVRSNNESSFRIMLPIISASQVLQ